MSDEQHADWSKVGAAFTTLGDQIQAHFSNLTKSAAPTQGSETKPFEDLGKQLDEALTSFRNAVNDPSIGDAAKGAADQLIEALKTEVDSAASKVSDATSPSAPEELPPAPGDEAGTDSGTTPPA